MVNLFTCTMTIFHSNQYLPNLLSNLPHTFKDFFSVYKSITLHYIQGSLLTVADKLSRATLTDCQTEVNENRLNCLVHSIISNHLISDFRLQQFEDKTKKTRH